MKILTMIIMTLSFVMVNPASGGSTVTEEVTVNIGTVLIPGGFDASTDIYAVVSGVYPNSCYEWKGAEVKHDFTSKKHEVRSKAYVTQGICMMVLVPWSEEVPLGVLGAGDHSIRFVNGDGTYMEKNLHLE